MSAKEIFLGRAFFQLVPLIGSSFRVVVHPAYNCGGRSVYMVNGKFYCEEQGKYEVNAKNVVVEYNGKKIENGWEIANLIHLIYFFHVQEEKMMYHWSKMYYSPFFDMEMEMFFGMTMTSENGCYSIVPWYPRLAHLKVVKAQFV